MFNNINKEYKKFLAKSIILESKGGFSYLPTNTMEIKNLNAPDNVEADLIELFTFLTTINPSEEAPIALSENSPHKVKIMRKFFYDNALKSKISEFLGVELDYNINKGMRFNNLLIRFGDGSRGNRGVHNTGNALETIIEDDLNEYLNGGNNYKQPGFIEKLSKIINLNEVKQIKPEGALNKKRGFKITDDTLMLGNGDKNVGEVVTDVTVVMNNGTEHYLSIKKSQTTSFANLSIRKIINPEEIYNYDIRNSKLKTLLEFFGIDEYKFCDVFSTYRDKLQNADTKEFKIDFVSSDADKSKVEEFLEQCIGYGYIYCHLVKNDWKIIDMTQSKLKQFVNINEIKIKYPTGSKYVAILIDCPEIKFEIKLRDRQGRILPNSLVIGYKFK